ncbi:VapE family protein [Spirosoma harenae]
MDKITKNPSKFKENAEINADNQIVVSKHQQGADDSDKQLPKFVRIHNYLSKRYEFRFNTVALDIEYRSKVDAKSNWVTCNEADLTVELLEYGYTGFDKLLTALLKSSYVPKYDPLRHYFENLPAWDQQTDYITQFASFVQTTDQDFFYTQFKKMLVRMLAQAFGAISFNKQCFTFYSLQNDGKTHFFEALIMKTPLQPYYKKNPDITGKESKRALAENFMLNLDELSALTKQDVGQVKATFAESQIKVRLPYDKKDSIMPRRASFVGSTNKREFLIDETGNVRWLVFEVLRINHDNGGPNGYMSVGVEKIWAQAYFLFSSGYPCQLTKEELEHSEANNSKYGVNTMEYQLLATHFTSRSKHDGGKFYQPVDLVVRLTELTQSKVKLNGENVGKALSKLGVPRVNGKKGQISVHGYYLIENLLGVDDSPVDYVTSPK